MKMTLKSTALLCAVALVSSVALAFVYTTTKPVISQRNLQKEQDALSLVLPGYTISGEAQIDSSDASTKYWTAEGTNGSKAWAFICEASGYSGTIRVMAGVDDSGRIIGISILNQSETPGLGARSVEVASSNTFLDFVTGKTVPESDPTPWFQKQFRGLSAEKKISVVKKGDFMDNMKESLLQNNEISAITGATITSAAVRDAVENGIERFRSVITK